MFNLFSRLSIFAAESAAGTEGTEEYVATIWDVLLSPSTLIMVVMLVAVYFFMIRPESKRKKAVQKLRNELIVGDEVTMSSGIVGKVVQIKDETVVIETGGDRTRISFLKAAISSKSETISS